MKRNLTEQEEQAIRLVHHDFGGLTIEEAATVMCLPCRFVKYLLESAQKKTPQLFPILNARQQFILAGWKSGASHEDIAEVLGVEVRALERDITFLREHGHIYDKPKEIPYAPHMDDQIWEKF